MNTVNDEMMATIRMFGPLGKTFGKTHQRLIRTTHEAFRALAATLPGFEKYMNSSKARGLTYAIFVGKKNIGEDDLEFPNNGREIHIVPVIIGSKRAGMLQTILGAVLVVVGAIAYAYGGAAVSQMGVSMMGAGIAATAGGVIQMLSPQPGGLASKQDADNKASYAFGGVTNTASQGYPVPICYGKRRIGGAIISAGIYVEDKM
ncbi:tail assembly protein [Atlantibacter subterranea]|uniref:Tail assembly protein n=1 Tax=Atlantibacter subterraneus TaxID=255519 RepID=A0A3R9FXQ9_9ENTR|nr:tail assembly protein [Atlantibacter subterranea]RSB63051.1 tail assembly protein [Atlantibacter subterranea]RSE06082.1 tail assembly protein [Atlantibacter subterranea]RSE27386.1 tail assembly protein [Atlantibacter subterranea]